MYNELDVILLNVDLLEYGLKKDDIGTIVAVYDSGNGYEVEFITYQGQTLAVLTLQPKQIKPLNQQFIMSARILEKAA